MFVFSFSWSSASAVLWNKIVAVYNTESLTLWDVEREIQLERIKSGLSPLPEISLASLKIMIKKIIMETLVIQEAQSFKLDLLSKENIESEYRQFREKFSDSKAFGRFLEKYHWNEKSLKDVLSRPIRVESFIKQKIGAVSFYISEEEIKSYQAQSKGLSHDEAKRRLKKKIIQKNLEEWISGLKNRNSIQILSE